MATKINKKKTQKDPTPKKLVQGAWITFQSKQILDQETKKGGFKSPTNLASKIISDWCEQKIRESENKG